MDQRIDADRALEILIKRLHEEVYKNHAFVVQGAPQRHFSQGFRHAVQRIEDFQKALRKRYPPTLTAIDEPGGA